MRLMPISMCQPGMKLSQNIYNEEGVVLLAENVELTQRLLNRLQANGIDYLYIQDPLTEDIMVSELLQPELKARALSEIRQTFRNLIDNNGSKSKLPYFHLGKSFCGLMDSILDDLSGHKNAMIMLTNMCITDQYLFQHSLNVCIYSTMLGMAYGYKQDELQTLGLGALLHDIGKTKIPQEILKKPGRLSDQEYEEMKKHTTFGFQILKDEPNIPLLSAHCALQHHERWNGTGYPRNLAGKDIHEFAQWIGIADSFDALTSQRVYREAMLPHVAMEIILADAHSLYDIAKVDLFRKKVAIYPIGSTLKLSSGEVGVVADLNTDSPQRPIVRILYDADSQPVTQIYEIDLSKKLSVMVTEVNPIMA
ncbi:HD-GYP domain-containing protein [Paenibacillus sp. N1-5-1-14]|uniref:HD-GYP domain-containing protein n=1 Tax=Paenibacillus radicibacter TaxID=2972488 RepID=UPI00215961A0|nr:HD-GYP domain-containing protein [Paenibacillus radicibacter]MCR8643680.1 HD-GYP domain-containing protein [Paenibacillus radicibacter]